MAGTNQLAVYEKIQDPLVFCDGMAKACAAIANCGEIHGKAVALVCLVEGITPLDFVRKYYLIQGKPTMRADAMLAEFRMNRWGDFRLIERSPDRAAIELIDAAGRKYTFELTKEQALESRWPWKDWQDHSKGLKDNWATPVDVKNMLWARLISDSLRAICPEICSGIYTPEEMADVLPEPVPHVPPTAAAVMQQQAGQEPGQDADVIDGELVAAEEVPDEEPPFEAPEPPVERPLVAVVRELFRTAFDDQAGEAAATACEKRGCSKLSDLTDEQLTEIRDRLQAKIAQSKN